MLNKVSKLDTQTEKAKQKNTQTPPAKEKQSKMEKRKGKEGLEEGMEKTSRFFIDITRQKRT